MTISRSYNGNSNKTTDCIKVGSSWNIKANILTTEEESSPVSSPSSSPPRTSLPPATYQT